MEQGRSSVSASHATAKVAFVLVPGLSMLSYVAAVECFRAANQLSGKTLYEWHQVQIGPDQPTASNGVEVKCDTAIGTSEVFDFVFVCASDEATTFKHAKTFSWLRSQERTGAMVGGIGGGAFILARAGLLRHHRVTLHWAYAAAFAEEFPDIDLHRSLFEIDETRMTCGGGMAPLDMLHDLFLRRHGPVLATGVSEWFLHTEIREGHRAQRMTVESRFGVRHPGLARALVAVEDALEKPLTRSELAHIACVSERQLDRLFAAQVGIPLKPYYLRLRLEHARSLVRQSNISLLEIAMASGFQSASTFSKAYRRIFGVQPSTERREIRIQQHRGAATPSEHRVH